MDDKEALREALSFLNEIGQALAFEEFLRSKGYKDEEIEEMWENNG